MFVIYCYNGRTKSFWLAREWPYGFGAIRLAKKYPTKAEAEAAIREVNEWFRRKHQIDSPLPPYGLIYVEQFTE